MAVLVIASASYADESDGLLTGCLTTAESVGFGNGQIGGFAGFGDDVTTIFGAITYGFSDYSEGRFKLGFADADYPNADPELTIGADFKYQFMDVNSKARKQPLDMAFGFLFEWADFGGSSLIQLGGHLTGSYPFRLSSGSTLSPYGRINIRMERVSYGDSETDFEGGFNMGVKWDLSESVALFGEIQIDGNTGLFTGLDFKAF
jgi:hypothetical protein